MSFLKRFSKSYALSALLVLLSGLISVYDNVMNVIFYDQLPRTEQNPIASWIIKEGGVASLVQIKSVTTILAVAIMLVLIKTKYRIVILPVFLFQIGLFFYLTFYVPAGSWLGDDFTEPIRMFFEFYQGKH